MPEEPQKPTLKILVAEDDKLTQRLYQQGLPAALCQLKIAANGEEALAIYREWRPHIIVLDYGMPIMNGYLTLKTIRATDQDQKTTIIMVTSMSDREHILACAQFGIQGYIVKPFKTGEIAKKILQFHRARK